jgi:hypothetical protein
MTIQDRFKEWLNENYPANLPTFFKTRGLVQIFLVEVDYSNHRTYKQHPAYDSLVAVAAQIVRKWHDQGLIEKWNTYTWVRKDL